MNMDLEKSRITEINTLHSEIGGYLKMTLDKAIRIGELLQDQKGDLKHGAWLPWVEGNLPFSERLAQDYMRFYDRREEIKNASLADLTEARKLLSPPSESLENEVQNIWIMMLETREWESGKDEDEDPYVTKKREKRVKLVKITDIIQIKACHARADTGVDYDKVKFLADFCFGNLPPIEINQENILIDGWHRLEAYKYAGKQNIRCFVTITEKPRDEKEIEILSVIRNAAHGLPFNEDDLRHQAVMRERVGAKKETAPPGGDSWGHEVNQGIREASA